jgi:hypothetical protein
MSSSGNCRNDTLPVEESRRKDSKMYHSGITLALATRPNLFMLTSVKLFRCTATLLLAWQIAALSARAASPRSASETGDWKSYRNARHGIAFRCPPDLEPIAEDHLLPDFNAQNDLKIWTYGPRRLNSLLRLGFVPTQRDRLAAEYELYVTSDVAKFFHLSPNEFLGHPPIHYTTGHKARNVDGLEATAIDFYDNDHLIHNVFVAHNNRVYLFVARDPSRESLKRFNALLSTVRFSRINY